MNRIRLSGLALAASMVVTASTATPIAPVTVVGAAATAQAVDTPCVDSEGASTGFFCQPLSAKGKLIRACSKKKPQDLAACQGESAQAFCQSRAFARASAYNIDGQGNLAEIVCTRSPVQGAAAAPATPVRPATVAAAPAEEWQPMFNVNLLGYDHREFGLARRDDWKSCKAACDRDGRCQAWTVSQEASTCYLKWDGNPELLSSNNCCITGIKGMASAGTVSEQKKVRTPEELKRLGARVQGAAEDEVGRRAEDAIRRSLGGVLGNN
ncbi:hypothetical protein E5675_15075 [Sphingopyxis sp. PAMC25046]|uniref:PAN domain-containing protein n=1 Tax=Sphingopyxis sp. PAMC25046 TaxID=2565556 RepID=UPI00109E2617|nr:PAN domain-containing protein [Sphingopyxis sp. PAMC25046]QCB55621.1 hypothetical protein E5675_15075 [Sphingopyxis sp. PAMC25046]